MAGSTTNSALSRHDDDRGFLNLTPLKASLDELIGHEPVDVSMEDISDQLHNQDQQDQQDHETSVGGQQTESGLKNASEPLLARGEAENMSKSNHMVSSSQIVSSPVTPEQPEQNHSMSYGNLHNSPKYGLSGSSTDCMALDGLKGPPVGPPVEHPATTLARAMAYTHYMNIAYRLIIWSLVGLFVYLAGSVFARDVLNKIVAHKENLLVDIAACQKQYFDNQCLPHMRAPALEEECKAWDKCMSQDPDSSVSHFASAAEAIVEIIGVFLRPLGSLGMVSLGSLILCSFIVIALIMKLLR